MAKVLELYLREVDTFQDTDVIQVGALKSDLVQRIVLLNDNEVRFSNIEFEILYLLASNPSRVFTTEQIYNIVWNGAYFGDYATCHRAYQQYQAENR